MKPGHPLLPATFPEPWADSYGQDRYGIWQGIFIGDVEQRFRWIPPGEFMMGSLEDEPERDYDEGPQHQVHFEQGFWLAEIACPQALWQAVMKKNPSYFKGDDRPVESVSWHDSQEFIAKLNQAKPGLNLRLPSEAEWEYACRAGTTTPFWWGSELTTDRANYDGNHPYNNGPKGEYRQETVPVKQFDRNPWGLYQMHGNVWEWCEDDWHSDYKGAPADGSPWKTDEDKEKAVLRGGSWYDYGWLLRSACRARARRVLAFRLPRPRAPRDVALASLGFRLARGPELQPSQPEVAGGARGQRSRGTSDAGGGQQRREDGNEV